MQSLFSIQWQWCSAPWLNKVEPSQTEGDHPLHGADGLGLLRDVNPLVLPKTLQLTTSEPL